MGKVAKFDSTADSAFAQIDLTSDQSIAWIEGRVRLDADALANGPTEFLTLIDNASGQLAAVYALSPDIWGSSGTVDAGNVPPATADSWLTFETYYEDGVEFSFYIEGTLVFTASGPPVGGLRSIGIGMYGPVDAIVDFDDVKIGTTRHGTDLFADDFEDGTFDAWTAIEGDATIIEDTTETTAQRVGIGLAADMLDPDPEWTYVDSVQNSLVARIEFEDGRQTERDQPEPGKAFIYLNDRDGLFDPNNPSSPYFGILDSKPIKVSVWNPVDEGWVPQWRGTIDDIRTILNAATDDGVSILANVVIECVDIFDYLGRAEMQIGVSGDAPPSGSDGTIFYEHGGIDTRITHLLDDAGVDPDMYVVFSGNVDVLETQYDPGDSFLSAIFEATDAEGPASHPYVDKLGRFVFHGRFARLDPDAVIADGPVSPDVWDFNRWKAGDGAAISGDSDNAQLREFAFGRPRDLLVNSATAYPDKEDDGAALDETKIPAQLSTDAASIGQHGIHGRTDAQLIVKGHKTNGDDGWDQCKKYADFWVAYYAQPLDRIERIVFTSVGSDDPRAAATWALLTGVSISDTIDVSVGYPGGVGFVSNRYYVEGRRMTVEPLTPVESGGFDMVTLELNLSPAVEDTEGIFD